MIKRCLRNSYVLCRCLLECVRNFALYGDIFDAREMIIIMSLNEGAHDELYV